MNAKLSASLLLAATLSAGPALAAEKIVFQFSWLPTGDRAGYYLAKDAGFFAAEGLDVQLVSGKGSTDAITKVATGVAQMAEGGLDALLTAKVQGPVPVTAVMPVFTKAPDSLAARKSAKIASLADLAGKTVATSPFTSSNGPWPFLLEMNGVDPASVKTIKADPATLPAMLATGKVDAIIQYIATAPATEKLLAEAGEEQVVIPWSNYGLDGYSASIFVSDAFLASNRDAVVRFTRALKKGEELMKADPARAAAAVKAAIPEIDLPLTERIVHTTLPLIFNEVTTADGLGTFTAKRVNTTWEWVAKQQKVAVGSMDPLKAVDFTITQGQ